METHAPESYITDFRWPRNWLKSSRIWICRIVFIDIKKLHKYLWAFMSKMSKHEFQNANIFRHNSYSIAVSPRRLRFYWSVKPFLFVQCEVRTPQYMSWSLKFFSCEIGERLGETRPSWSAGVALDLALTASFSTHSGWNCRTSASQDWGRWCVLGSSPLIRCDNCVNRKRFINRGRVP